MSGKSNFKVKSGKNEVWRKEQENECNLKDDECGENTKII